MFDVPTADGGSESWKGESGALNTLNRNGLSRNTMEVGSPITLVGPVSRIGRNEVLAAKIISGGKEYVVFPAVANLLLQPPPEQDGTMTTAAGYVVPIINAPDIFGVWAPVRFPGTAIFLADLPLTDNARAQADAYDPVADDLANKCTPAGIPGMLDQPYPIEFIDEGDSIRMRFEEWEGERIIYMDDSADAGVESIFGHSNGSWDGDTLVIVTSGMGYPYYDDAGTPLTEDMLVTERYTIDEEQHRLNWSATTVDADVFTEPAVMEGWMVWTPGLEIRSFECADG